MRRQAHGLAGATSAIEIPGSDYPPPQEFTEDLENEDVPPEKLSEARDPRQRSRRRLGWDNIREEHEEPSKRSRRPRSRKQ